MSRATLDKQPHEVASMFDAVSRRYDITNTVLSLGLDSRWRRQTRRAVDPRAGQLVLDLAAGTGVSTAELSATGARAVACDFSLGMLQAGRRRSGRRALPFVAGDALALPFADGVFDAATISFGLRNVADVPLALQELSRVTRPGGRLVVCEFSRPVFAPFRAVYLNYLMRALPWMARRVASNPDAYVYLAESIRAWPEQAELARIIGASGWTNVRWRNMTGGIVALHRATRPRQGGADAGPPVGGSAGPGSGDPGSGVIVDAVRVTPHTSGPRTRRLPAPRINRRALHLRPLKLSTKRR